MAYFYRSSNRAQQFLLPPSVTDWLPQEHLVWFVLDVVSMVDMSGFHVQHSNDGVGRPAYDPEVMLALLVYAYCTGTRSSRKIEAACTNSLPFMVICGDLHPDFRSVARFRQVHETAIRDAFCDVLRLCETAGLVQLGTVAIDGTKMAADAALAKNRSKSWVAEQVNNILTEAADADRVDQPDFAGHVPEVLARPGSRRARLQEALRQIEADDAKEAAEAQANREKLEAEAKEGRKPKGPKPKDPDAAAERAELDLMATKARQANATDPIARLQAHTAVDDAQAALDAARKRAAAETTPKPERQANIVDPDSRIMKTQAGWLQGYNAQAAVNEKQIILAATISNHANDSNEYVPVHQAVTANLATVGTTATIVLYLLDAGYWSQDNATTPGPDRLIATQKDWKQRKAARELGTTSGPPPPDAEPVEQMEHRLRTPEGAAAYAKRSQIVEPVFGQSKENRGYRRFMRRGLTAVDSEWSLICWTGNLLKLFTHANGRTLADTLTPAT